jgi:aryl-alcohol dehydrogenase-like predicted oxidoreductase
VSPTLPATSFGPNGQSVTRLGLGGEGVLRTFGRDAEAAATIDAAIDAGITYFESARAYSGSEDYLGRALGARRARVFLASKAHDRTRRGALAMLEASLRALRTDVLDLWQLHDVRTLEEVDAFEDPEGAYAAFADAKQRGLVRAIGVTGHHDPAVLRAALERFAFDSVLLPINPAEGALRDAFERTVVPAARARGMAVVGMKVLARGLLLSPRTSARVTAREAIHYALSADVDVLVIGCDDPAQVAENAHAARSFARQMPDERGALERRFADIAEGLAYYRGPRSGMPA